MRKINRIVLHCTATQPTATVQGIINYWEKVKKWKSKGYHWIVEPCGNITNLTKVQNVSNGARGFNRDSIHISYIGGVNKDNIPTDTRTKAQKASVKKIILATRAQFGEIPVQGHRDLKGVTKACPSHCVPTWLEEEGL